MDKAKLPPDLQEKVSELNRAIFMREADQAAVIYQAIIQHQPDFLLREQVQYDLARLLEQARQDELAFTAYKHLITKQKAHKSMVPALRAAGILAFNLKNYELCVEYIHAF